MNENEENTELDSVDSLEMLDSGLEIEDIVKVNRNINVTKVICEAIKDNESKIEYSRYLKDSEDFEKYMKLLLNIRDWLIDCELATRKEKEVIQNYISNFCDVSKTAIELGLTRVAVRKHLSRFNTKVLEKLGKDMIIALQNGKYSTAYELYRVRGNNVGITDILPTDLLINLPEAKFDVNCNLKDYEYELKMLRVYSISTMQKNIAKASEKGLSYLLGLLQTGNTLYSVERHIISEFINGNIDTIEEMYKQIDNLYKID